MIRMATAIRPRKNVAARALEWSGRVGCAALAIVAGYTTAAAAPEESAEHLQAGTVVESSRASPSARAQDDLAGKLARHEVQRSRSSIPGLEIVQVATEIPPGVESGWHIHPGEEVGYIIAGRIEMMIEGRATAVLRAGEGFLIPPRTPHNAHDLGPETGLMLSTYIVEAGQPLSTFVNRSDQR